MTPIECKALADLIAYLEQDQARNPDHWVDDGYEVYSAMRKLKELIPSLKAWSERPDHEQEAALAEVTDEGLKELLKRIS